MNEMESVKDFLCGLGRMELRYMLKKHLVMFYWQVAHTTSDFLRDILWCYLGENLQNDAELIVILNGKHWSLEDTREHFGILCVRVLFIFVHFTTDLFVVWFLCHRT